MRKPVFHLSGEHGWRGGEVQLELLLSRLASNSKDRLFVPKTSELARRVAFTATIPIGRLGFAYPAAALTVRRAIKQAGEPVILHAHSSKAIETALLAGIGLNAQLVISRHTAFPVTSGWKYRAATALVAVSDATQQRLIRAGVDMERIEVIPIAVDDTKLDSAVVSGFVGHGPIVLHAAAFTAEKDHRTLLQAWALVEKSHPTAVLLLAGDGPLWRECSAHAEEIGLRRVEFVGWVETVGELVKRCDLAVLSSRFEGFSTFLCEAQWCGKAVAATRAGGTAEAVAHGITGLLSEPGNIEALAHNVLDLIDDVRKREQMGASAAVRARQMFSPDRLAKAHERLYGSL